jgi:hypothetical protein
MGTDQTSAGPSPGGDDVIADEGPVRPLDWTGTGDPTPHVGAIGGQASSEPGGPQTPEVIPATDGPSSGSDPADTATLAAGAASDLRGIAEAELQLAKTEAAGEARAAAAGAGAIAAGAAAGIVGSIFALLGLTELLARWMPRWAAAGLVGGTLAASGAGLALGGKRRLTSLRPLEQTMRTLKENGTWIRTLGNRAKGS